MHAQQHQPAWPLPAEIGGRLEERGPGGVVGPKFRLSIWNVYRLLLFWWNPTQLNPTQLTKEVHGFCCHWNIS